VAVAGAGRADWQRWLPLKRPTVDGIRPGRVVGGNATCSGRVCAGWGASDPSGRHLRPERGRDCGSRLGRPCERTTSILLDRAAQVEVRDQFTLSPSSPSAKKVVARYVQRGSMRASSARAGTGAGVPAGTTPKAIFSVYPAGSDSSATRLRRSSFSDGHAGAPSAEPQRSFSSPGSGKCRSTPVVLSGVQFQMR